MQVSQFIESLEPLTNKQKCIDTMETHSEVSLVSITTKNENSNKCFDNYVDTGLTMPSLRK